MKKHCELVMGPAERLITPEQMAKEFERFRYFLQEKEAERVQKLARLEESLAKLTAHLTAGEQLASRCKNDEEKEAIACMLAHHRQRMMEIQGKLSLLRNPLPRYPLSDL